MAIESIVKTLGSGSGIDTTALVEQLVTAQFQAKTDALTKQNDTLTAQISAVSALKSGITGFDSALTSLIKSGSLTTQPASSNTGVLTATTLSGASIGNLSASVEVRQLASGQTSSSGPLDATKQIGTGKLTLAFGTATVANGAMSDFQPGTGSPVDIAITDGHATLQDIASAINAKNAGVTASVLSDSDGARLVLKSATGADQAFTLTATEDEDAPGLAALNVGVDAIGTTIASVAQDAVVAVDGIALKRPSNTIKDLVPGVQLNLVSASPGTRVSLTAVRPTDGLSQAVSDVASAYNELLGTMKTDTDAVAGPLRADSAARNLLSSMSRLTTQVLVPDAPAGAPRTLAEIGLQTNRDGTLTVDSTALAAALAKYPDTVEAMFKQGAGLSSQLSTIANSAADNKTGLGASADRYTKAQADLADDQTKATDDAAALRTRMTQQFAKMDAMVASYKSTQTFLQQQVDAWNGKNN